VFDSSGKVAVPTQTVKGKGIDKIEDLETPSQPGPYKLKLWLEDAEGNAGAAVTAPLAYECVRLPARGARLDAGFAGRPSATLQQGQGAPLEGSLRDASGNPVAGAAPRSTARPARPPTSFAPRCAKPAATHTSRANRTRSRCGCCRRRPSAGAAPGAGT
jgi:hypothetical protein